MLKGWGGLVGTSRFESQWDKKTYKTKRKYNEQNKYVGPFFSIF